MSVRIQPTDVALTKLPPLNLDQAVRAGVAQAEVAAPVSVAFGDGVGPEIMEASLRVLFAAGAKIDVREIELGESVYLNGETSGIDESSWEIIRRTRALYKAPITTPQAGGMKSVNVTLRKSLGLYANVRPCVAYHPVVATKHPGMDVVIVRENEEDLYAGIEHRQTDEVYQCLKLVSRSGCERIVRYAFEYARCNGRRRVACFTKDNIMKMTDGLFHEVFIEIGAEYPEIEQQHWIVDAGAAQLADDPGRFDVIVLPNLYGDILSDVAAEIAGSIALAPSANIGLKYAMFEAIHGSAPGLGGRDMANPSGLILAGAIMLAHLGQARAAELVHNALLKTIEEGIHTFDIYSDEFSSREVGTSAFAAAVIDRLGERPVTLKPACYIESPVPTPLVSLKAKPKPRPAVSKELVGIDVFVHWQGQQPRVLAETMRCAQQQGLELVMITNRGVKVWPKGHEDTIRTDHWRCRYKVREGSRISLEQIADLQMRLAYLGVEFIKTEHLCNFDGVPGYSLGQGQ